MFQKKLELNKHVFQSKPAPKTKQILLDTYKQLITII